MQHLLVYTKSISGTLQKVTWLTDPAVSPDASGNPILPKPMFLQWGAFGGVNITQAQLNVPSLRTPFLPSLYPLMSSDTISSDPNIFDYRGQPFLLPMNQGLEVDATLSSGTASATGCLSISEEQTPAPIAAAQIFTTQFTASITCVARTFVSGTVTFQNSLPYGTYAVVGGTVQSATGIFWRLIFPGQAWRPGTFCCTALTNRGPFAGRKQPHGVWGTFVSTSPPQVEVMAQSTDSSQTGYLDLIKIA